MPVQKAHSQRFLLVILIGLGVFLRILAALAMGDKVVELPGIQDQLSYHALALRLLEGHGYSFPTGWYPFTAPNTPTAHWSFAYPLYLASVYTVFGVHPLAARLLQAVFVGCLTGIFVYRLSRRVFGEPVALVAVGIASVYTYFIYYSAALMTEALFMVASLAILELAYLLAERPTLLRAMLLGVVLGIAILLRQAILLFIPALMGWLWGTGRKRLAPQHFLVPLVIAGLFVVPWTWRNYKVYGRFLLLNSNAGYAFFSSNHPTLGSQWLPEKSVTPIPAELTGLNEAQMDSALMQQGIGFALADPKRYFLLTVSRLAEYYKFWPSADSSLISNLQRPLSFGLLLPLTLYGLYLARARLRLWILPLLYVATTAITYLLSWPTARYRVPTDACLIPLAALAVLSIYTKITENHKAPREDPLLN